MLSISSLQSALSQYQPDDPLECQHLARVNEFAARTAAPFYRDTLVGHITTSCVLTDLTQNYFLLIWHAKLQRWLQPGGHCEPTDDTLQSSALRELLEETGLSAAQVRLVSERIFDIDVHAIPARGREPEHWHYDLRFHFGLVPAANMNSDNVNGANMNEAAPPLIEGATWLPVAQVAELPEPSLARMGRKLLR